MKLLPSLLLLLLGGVLGGAMVWYRMRTPSPAPSVSPVANAVSAPPRTESSGALSSGSKKGVGKAGHERLLLEKISEAERQLAEIERKYFAERPHYSEAKAYLGRDFKSDPEFRQLREKIEEFVKPIPGESVRDSNRRTSGFNHAASAMGVSMLLKMMANPETSELVKSEIRNGRLDPADLFRNFDELVGYKGVRPSGPISYEEYQEQLKLRADAGRAWAAKKLAETGIEPGALEMLEKVMLLEGQRNMSDSYTRPTAELSQARRRVADLKKELELLQGR